MHAERKPLRRYRHQPQRGARVSQLFCDDALGRRVSVDRALADDAKVIAGGQSLLPPLRLAYPELLVDVGGIDELRDVLVIGSRTAAPPGDLPAVILASDGTLIARGPIAAAEFFVDYLTTSLKPDEILTAIRFPKLGPGWGYRYEKFHRTAQSWATVGVAALARWDNGTVAKVRIGLTNMGPVPVRATAAEQAASGAAASRAALTEAAARADEGTQPPGGTWPGC